MGAFTQVAVRSADLTSQSVGATSQSVGIWRQTSAFGFTAAPSAALAAVALAAVGHLLATPVLAVGLLLPVLWEVSYGRRVRERR